MKKLNFSCLRHPTYILADPSVELCEAGLRLKRRKWSALTNVTQCYSALPVVWSTWKASRMALFLTFPCQVLLKSIVSSAFRIHPESGHIPSPPLSPIVSCPAFYTASLTTTIIFSEDEAFGTSVNLCQSSSRNILTVFHHSGSWSPTTGPKGLMCWIFFYLQDLESSLTTLHFACFAQSSLPRLFAFHWPGHICLCVRAFAHPPPWVQNSLSSRGSYFHFIRVFSNVSSSERPSLITPHKKATLLPLTRPLNRCFLS